MTIICYPNCSTCKKAVAYLEEKGFAFTYRNIKEDRLSSDELSSLWRKSGLPLKRFFNTSGQLYRTLKLKDRLETLCDDELLTLLASDGMLVKRPLLVLDKQVLVGFRLNEWEGLESC